MTEEYKQVRDFPAYWVSNTGKVQSRRGNKIVEIKPFATGGHNRDYRAVVFHEGKKQTMKYVHRLVAEAFIPNPQNKKHVDHINDIPSDNRLENLQWLTCSENVTKSYRRRGK